MLPILSKAGCSGGSCQNNWFSVIGANGGMQVVPSMCGERRGQSSKIKISTT